MINNPKVFVTDIAWENLGIEESILKDINADIKLGTVGKSPSEICDEGSDADVVLQLFTLMTRENLGRLKKCKLLVRMGIGTNSIDLDAATDMGICVANVPDYCQEEVADHTIALFLSIVRKVHLLVQQVRDGGWDMTIADPVPRLRGKIFAQLGYGGIARMTAARAASLGLKIVAYDPYVSDEVFAENNVERYTDINALFRDADFLSLHVPATKETVKIVNAERLAMMKKSSYLINTSRGDLIDEDDLYDAVKAEVISGAALDVLCKEPPVGVHKLATLQNVIITPHAAWNSDVAINELRAKVAEEVVRFVKEGRVKNLVNKAVLERLKA